MESSHWRVWSDPDRGVQWMAAQVKHNNRWIDVVPDCRQDTAANSDTAIAGQNVDAMLPAANFHMIPYSNRIRDGQFEFQGKQIQLQDGQSHAMHGALRKMPWRVTHVDDSSLTCEFDSRTDGTINWPWPLLARIEQQVQEDTLSSRITVTNTGSTNMPVGAGWHPYFVRNIGLAPPTLTLPVDAVFPDESGDCLPDGAAVPLPSQLDFRKARALDPDQRIDCCLAGLSDTCVIDWKEAGIKLQMTSSENCRFLVLYNPDMPHFAVEPVTNANDALNLHSQGIDGGMTTLAAGETLSISMELQVQFD